MKVSFIGAGRIGSSTAFSVLHAIDSVKDMVILDIMGDLAEGEALDLKHAAYAMERGDVKIKGTTDYKDTKDSDIYVVSAGVARKPGQTREELAAINYKIVKSIGEEIKKYGKDSIVITATNPMDAMNYAMWKTTGFDRKKLIGMGGILDTARLHSLGYDGFVVGAHGENMVTTENLGADVVKKVVAVAPEVIKKKGATFYAPAVALNRMIYAILNDTNEILPCSCVLDGEYGLSGLSIGVPAKLGRKGVAEITELELGEPFNKAADSIKAQIAALGL